MSFIYPYSTNAYSNRFECDFLSGFTHARLAQGAVDQPLAKQFVEKSNECAQKCMPCISFNQEALQNQKELKGGACSPISFRISRSTLKIARKVEQKPLSSEAKDRVFSQKFTRKVMKFESMATSQRKPDKTAQIMIRTEQFALNTITVNRKKITSGNAVKEKVTAMAAFYDLKVVDSTKEIRVKGNPKLKEELTSLVQRLQPGVYFLRIIQEKKNHKLEEKGHSALYIKRANGSEYYFDPALGNYSLISEEGKQEFLYQSLRSANERFGVDTFSFHRLEESNLKPIQTRNFTSQSLPLYGQLHFPPGGQLKNRPLLIFSPGLGNLVSKYKKVTKELCRQNYVVLCVNFPEVGAAVLNQKSRLKENKIIDLGLASGQHLSALVKEIHKGNEKAIPTTKKVVLLGHSLGGSSSIEAARLNPHIKAAINFDGRIIKPEGVKPPVLQVVATKLNKKEKKGRIAYNQALKTLCEQNPNAKTVEMKMEHGEIAEPSERLLSSIVEQSLAFLKTHVPEEKE